MKTTTTWMLLAVLGIGMTGCVAQQRADKLQTAYRESQNQVLALQQQLKAKDAQIESLQNAKPQPDPQMLAQIKDLQQQRDQLKAALAKAEKQLNDAGSNPMLPQQLNDELAQLASEHPNLMSYDPKRGMVKLSSDLTFGLGSAQVNSSAKQTLARLASVLNSAQAKQYDVRVAGYTDNVPIKNPRTKAKFPNNWYLSAGRAIAVEKVLQDAGIDPHRMGVSGYSMYRPVVPNGAHGARQNRRVEIFLVPKSSSATSDSMQQSNTGSAAETSVYKGKKTPAGTGSSGKSSVDVYK